MLGLGIDERFARGGMAVATDALGSTIALVGSSVVQTAYGYDPYGVAQVTGNATTNPFQFTGRESDGTGLMHYRNRYYNPAWGRFISEDPIGLAGGINVYAYAGGNPVNFRDPSGLCPVCFAAWEAYEAYNALTLAYTAVTAGLIVGDAVTRPTQPTPTDCPSYAVCANSGDKDASTPTGRRGSPIDVEQGTNEPTTINGRNYTGHALDQMQGRGVPPSAVEDAIRNGSSSPGNRPGTTVNEGSNGVTAVTGQRGQVITVINR